MPYADLELSLQRQGDAYAVELCFQPAPGAPVAHLLVGEPPCVRFDAAALLKHSLDAAAYGAGLTNLLFADARVREAFVKARAHAHAVKALLRLRLRLDADDEALHTLRWETLCDLDGGGFLCASERLLVTRYLDSADMSPLDIHPRRELRALVAVANPVGLEKYPNLALVDVAGEVARSQAALADIPTAVLAREASGQPVTLDAIVSALRDGPDILYLVAHGTQKDGESYLWLENEGGGIGRVSGRDFVDQIRNLADRPVLIVLASCQSAGTSHNAGGLLALGPRLASAGIAAVVAMQGDVSMDTVATFMPHFFRELRRDGQIDRALAVARAAQLERPDWWMPVLFLRVPDGLLWSTPPFDPPPAPERPPEAASFVGREAELAAFAAKLASEHLAEITGMPGVGKTALAAVLAGRLVAPEKLFWHSFHSGEGADNLIWALAGFLAINGQAEVWEMIQRNQQDGGKPPPPNLLFDYLLQPLQGQGYLLCLDDFQYVDEDPQLNEFIECLRPALTSGGLTLLVTSRRVPDFATLHDVEMLTGLSPTDARLLLEARKLTMSGALVDGLYMQTGGNAQLLTLAIDALQGAADPARIVGDLIEAKDIARYLMHEVNAGLNADERQVMGAVAALLDYGGTRDAIEAALDGESVFEPLITLHERYLLTTSAGAAGDEYRQHAIVQAFYYDLLGRRDRETLHCRLGAYYETEERDSLRAALHFERAGDDARAVDLAAADIWTLINSGQARTLLQLLERLVARQVDPTDTRHLDADRWIAVNIACGEVYSRLRQSDLARERYQTAFALLTTQADAPQAREKRATVCRGMGELLEYESPHEALGWLRRGKDEAAGSGTLEEGVLSLREGSVLIATGAFAAAREALEQSLRLLPEGAGMWRGKAQLNLGVIACNGGDLRRGKDYFLQAEALFTQAHDDWDLATVWQNLGRVQVLSGDWAGAGEVQQKALALAERLGNGTSQAALEYSLGLLATNQGQHEQALAHLSKCLELARAQTLREYVVSAQSSLAELHIRQGAWEAAAGALAEAEPLARELDAKDQLSEIYRGLAQVQLGRGDPTAALAEGERALAVARELGDKLGEGVSLRVVAQALLAAGRADEALAAFAQSMALLDEQDPYEAARSRAAWGAALLAGGDAAGGTSLLQAARDTFTQLGAQGDLAVAEAAELL